MDIDLLSVFLPSVLIDHFDIVKYDKSSGVVNLYFCEKNVVPTEFSNLKLHSKGFHKQITIQDFPIRGLKVYLHIQRRRWIVVDSKNLVERDWNLVAQGTRMTEEFSSFLKEINRY